MGVVKSQVSQVHNKLQKNEGLLREDQDIELESENSVFPSISQTPRLYFQTLNRSERAGGRNPGIM